MNDKRCTKCRKLKSLDEFANKTAGKKCSWCKPCHNAYTKKHYKANTRYYVQKSRNAARKRAEYVQQLKARPCHDCKEVHPHYVMEFDHTRGVKVNCISRLTGASWKQLLAEIEKCDVVCANCHCKRTFRRRGGMADTPDLESGA